MEVRCLALKMAPEIEIGKYYAYIRRGVERICVGQAVLDEKVGYGWAMKNCHTGKINRPLTIHVICPDSRYSEIHAALLPDNPDAFKEPSDNESKGQ